jgi:hypothetical protein
LWYKTTFFFSSLTSHVPHLLPFLRRHAIRVGSIGSLLSRSAKEAADQLGFFQSSGASSKEAVASGMSGNHPTFVFMILK